ncbi:hypothetical protein AURANDRAFT_69009 [Aureococcus anophagefferens]|uniref:Uncharacterized protein n=1 Tax=Aureococcus anophagefferens TaxID=44056 RepID=F0YRG1_AURAN|nr:hypothetical protein AURANDRAFT_69009 [Aureococcus anophagefferens]EGB02298.1 hypothetical protein AURANDRAFT_69009 [Aureococcus anophagefferens]|eukprot:XP_009043003.1 hypothetical protein AURANDRAFT_69009 [Aureococcus anophagefferens]
MSTRSKKYRVEGEGPSAEIPSRAIDAHDGGRDVDEDKQELQIEEFYESLGPVGVLSSRLPRCRRDPVRPRRGCDRALPFEQEPQVSVAGQDRALVEIGRSGRVHIWHAESISTKPLTLLLVVKSCNTLCTWNTGHHWNHFFYNSPYNLGPCSLFAVPGGHTVREATITGLESIKKGEGYWDSSSPLKIAECSYSWLRELAQMDLTVVLSVVREVFFEFHLDLFFFFMTLSTTINLVQQTKHVILLIWVV